MTLLRDFRHGVKLILPLTLIFGGCGGSHPHSTSLTAVVKAPQHAFVETFEVTPVRAERLVGVIEMGRGSGTIPASIHLTFNEGRLSASFVAHAERGDLEGHAHAYPSSVVRRSLSPKGEEIAFSGTGSIDSGTGIFVHSRASGLQVHGLFVEDATGHARLIVHLNGTLIR